MLYTSFFYKNLKKLIRNQSPYEQSHDTKKTKNAKTLKKLHWTIPPLFFNTKQVAYYYYEIFEEKQLKKYKKIPPEMAGKINKKYFDVLEMRFCAVLSFFNKI